MSRRRLPSRHRRRTQFLLDVTVLTDTFCQSWASLLGGGALFLFRKLELFGFLVFRQLCKLDDLFGGYVRRCLLALLFGAQVLK